MSVVQKKNPRFGFYGYFGKEHKKQIMNTSVFACSLRKGGIWVGIAGNSQAPLTMAAGHTHMILYGESKVWC